MLLLVVVEAVYLKVFSFKKYVIVQYIYYGVLLLYSYLILAYHGTLDSQTAPVNQILTHMFEILVTCSLLVNILIKRGYTLTDFRDLLIAVIVLQGFIILIELVSFDFRKYLQGLIGRKAKQAGSFRWFRALAFSLNQNYDFALFQSFGLLLMVSKFVENRVFSRFDIVSMVVILISVITAGRTGFIGIGTALMFFFIKTSHQGLFTKFVRNLFYTIFILLVIYYSSSVLFPKVYDAVNNQLLPWAFEFYYNFTETGELSTSSSDQLLTSHYFNVPDDVIIYGKGIYNLKDGSYFNATDAGYMRQIYYFGFFGILLFIILYSRIGFYFYRNADKAYNFIVPTIVALMIIVHIKGDLFTNSLLMNKALYFFTIALLTPRAINSINTK
jgi:hypothetical protein